MPELAEEARANRMPSYEQLCRGPMKPMPLQGAKGASLGLNVWGDAETVVRLVKRHKIGDSWYVNAGGGREGVDAIRPYIATGWPMALSGDVAGLVRHQQQESPGMTEFIRLLEKENAGPWSIHAGEWSNWLDWSPAEVFGRLPLDRQDMYELICASFRRWATALKGHINSMNGYGFLFHIGAEQGEDFVGTEIGENIPAAQVAYAFSRGAARQFELPWYCQTSQWYAGTVPSGSGEVRQNLFPPAEQAWAPYGAPKGWLDDTNVPGGHAGIHSWWHGIPKALRRKFRVAHDYPGMTSGPDCGHSVSMLFRLWATSWFAGAAITNLEAASGYVFKSPYGESKLTNDAELSEYGLAAQKLFALMEEHTEGVAYTPFAVLVGKYHGQMTFWDKPWRMFEPTEGDEMTVNFFDQAFSGQSTGPGREESYLCPSPYGDSFDVFVNRADLRALSGYPVVIAVGDVPWSEADVHFLRRYVKAGGTLVLNEIHIDENWDRSFLGLRENGFTPGDDATVVLAAKDGRPLLIRRNFGRGGRVFIAARRCDPDGDTPAAVPDALLDRLADEYLPVRVDGPAEFLIRRTLEGWAVMLVNNNGFHKEPTQPPVIDTDAPRRFVLSWTGKADKIQEWTTGDTLTPTASGERHELALDIAPGELKIVHLVFSR